MSTWIGSILISKRQYNLFLNVSFLRLFLLIFSIETERLLSWITLSVDLMNTSMAMTMLTVRRRNLARVSNFFIEQHRLINLTDVFSAAYDAGASASLPDERSNSVDTTMAVYVEEHDEGSRTEETPYV